MKILTRTNLALIFLACSLHTFASSQGKVQSQKAQVAASGKNSNKKDGAIRFRENCGRCHNPPEAVSPREVKAVLQHMRVRAMLTQEDEQLILKYLAP